MATMETKAAGHPYGTYSAKEQLAKTEAEL